jgi:Protein of unknown function (DUF2911)
MRKFALLCAACLAAFAVKAQLDLPPSGGNPRAMISEEVGITSITLKYSRPDVAKRENIWGSVVTWGFSTSNLTTNKNTNPWRAGANENTTISFEHDVKVEGRDLKAGTYGLHMAVWPDSVVLIFSNETNAWGSFYYDAKEDALRVTVKPVVQERNTEWLKYEFIEHKEKSCTIAMFWEKWMIPFKVEVDVDNIVVAGLRSQVKSNKGFNGILLLQAAQYCVNKGVNLEEALGWAQRASGSIQGQNFAGMRAVAAIYEKLNKLKEADSVMVGALAVATAQQYAGYGRALTAQKRFDKAMETFTAAQKKHGDVFALNNGMMFMYSAKGEFAAAIQSAEKAKAQAPSDAAKKTLEAQIERLKKNQDINN